MGANQGVSPPAALSAKLVDKRERALLSYLLGQKGSYSTETETHQQAALHQGEENAFRREAGCRSAQESATKAINSFKFPRLGKGLWLAGITLKVKLAQARRVPRMRSESPSKIPCCHYTISSQRATGSEVGCVLLWCQNTDSSQDAGVQMMRWFVPTRCLISSGNLSLPPSPLL